MGGYFSSIKVDEAVSATNVTNDAEHDDVLVLSVKCVDPLEIKMNENNIVDENVNVVIEEKKDLDLSSSSCSGYEIRTTTNDVVYYTKKNKKKNKNKKNKGKGINK
jgi:hypothetical protein